MNKRAILYCALLTFFAVSCKSPYDSISLKTGATSKTLFDIPTEFRQKGITILDRTDCINDPYIEENADATVNTINSSALDYLKKEIKEREFYKYEELELRKEEAVCSNNFFPKPLGTEEVKEYSNSKNIVLTFENIEYSEKDNYRKDVESTYDKNKVLIKERNVVIGEKNISAEAAIKVYDTLGQLIDSLIIKEKYTYEVKEANRLLAQNSLRKGRNLAVINIGKKIGFEIAEAISPYNITIYRYYYAYSRTNSKFNAAQDIIKDEDDWLSASFVWRQIAETDKDDVERAKAFYNLGLFHEKNGEFDLAINMLEEATLLNEDVGREYLNDLKNRYGQE